MAGPLGLVGSGEFTPAMRDVDARLLGLAEEEGFDRVVAVLPTASAPDGDATYRRWFAMAHDHYAALDAEVLELDVRGRGDALELGPIADVEHAGFVYLSGGKPDHLTAVLRGSPLLDAVLERWRLGAPLVGCSAGAMALSAGWPPFRRPNGEWGTGLGVLPDVAVVPHFDRVRRITLGAAARVGRRAPRGVTTVGIDEDTALVHGPDGWSVHGAGDAWLLGPGGPDELDAGQLPPPR